MGTVKCRNCGAEIDENVTSCPYCSAMQDEASERAYMKHLYRVHGELDQLDEHASGYIRKQLLKAGLIALAGMAAALGIGGFSASAQYREYHDSAAERAEIEDSLDWYDANMIPLNQYMEKQQYRQAAELTDTYVGDRDMLQRWSHYGCLYTYQQYYSYLEEMQQELEQGETVSSYRFAHVLDACMNYLNLMTAKKSYEHRYYAMSSSEDQAIMEGWQAEIERFFLEQIGVSEAQWQTDYRTAYPDGRCDYERMKELEERYYQLFCADTGRGEGVR